MEHHICKYCGKEFKSGKQLGGHTSRCKLNPNFKQTTAKVGNSKTKSAEITEYKINCCICNKEYVVKISKQNFVKGNYKKTCSRHCASILTGKRTNKTEKNKKISEQFKGRRLDEKTKTFSKNNPAKIKYCINCGNEIDINIRQNSKFCCDDCKNIHWRNSLSKSLKGKTGGYRVLSGNKKHKSGKYNGIYFDSSWELAFYIYHKEHNLFVDRCTEIRSYTYNERTYKYYPDFVTDEGIIEIKGYLTERTNEKLKQNPDIKVLFYGDIKLYLDYVNEKYGNTFWEKFYI